MTSGCSVGDVLGRLLFNLVLVFVVLQWTRIAHLVVKVDLTRVAVPVRLALAAAPASDAIKPRSRTRL